MRESFGEAAVSTLIHHWMLTGSLRRKRNVDLLSVSNGNILTFSTLSLGIYREKLFHRISIELYAAIPRMINMILAREILVGWALANHNKKYLVHRLLVSFRGTSGDGAPRQAVASATDDYFTNVHRWRRASRKVKREREREKGKRRKENGAVVPQVAQNRGAKVMPEESMKLSAEKSPCHVAWCARRPMHHFCKSSSPTVERSVGPT